MDNSDDIQQLKEELNNLRRQIEELKAADYQNGPQVEATESLLAFGYKRLRFDFLKKWLARIPAPEQLKKKIDSGFVEERQEEVRNLALELLKNMPALQVARLFRKAPHKLDLEGTARFKKTDLEGLLGQQRAFFEEYLSGHSDSFRREIQQTRYQIGQLREMIKNKRDQTKNKNGNFR